MGTVTLPTAGLPAADRLSGRRTGANAVRMTQHTPERPTGSLDDQLTARLMHQRILALGQEVDDTIAEEWLPAGLLDPAG